MQTSFKTLTFAAALMAGTFLSLGQMAMAQEDRPNITIALQSMGSAGTLDTSDNGGTAARKYQNSIFEQLIALDLSDPKLAAKPGLATEWHWVDPTTLELKLREGVKFHNGDTMTADDVVFSFSDERYGLLPEQTKPPATPARRPSPAPMAPPASCRPPSPPPTASPNGHCWTMSKRSTT